VTKKDFTENEAGKSHSQLIRLAKALRKETNDNMKGWTKSFRKDEKRQTSKQTHSPSSGDKWCL